MRACISSTACLATVSPSSLSLGHRSDLRASHLWHAWVVKSLALHLLSEGERPHPELTTKHLLHVLQPEHVVVIRSLLCAAVPCPGHFCTDTWVSDLLVLHHLNSGQVVVQLEDDAEGERDEGNRYREAHEVCEVETDGAKRAQLWSVVRAEEAVCDQAPPVNLSDTLDKQTFVVNINSTNDWF